MNLLSVNSFLINLCVVSRRSPTRPSALSEANIPPVC